MRVSPSPMKAHVSSPRCTSSNPRKTDIVRMKSDRALESPTVPRRFAMVNSVPHTPHAATAIHGCLSRTSLSQDLADDSSVAPLPSMSSPKILIDVNGCTGRCKPSQRALSEVQAHGKPVAIRIFDLLDYPQSDGASIIG